MNIVKPILVIAVVFITTFSYAQDQTMKVIEDGIYEKLNNKEREPISYTSLREADVMWSKRIWRRIDLREKLNHPLYFPNEPSNGRKSLFDVIVAGIENGDLYAFDPANDDFRTQLTKDQALEALQKITIKQVEDPNNPGEFFEITDTIKIESRDVIQYQLKEDWFFDKQRSVMDVRIVGIAPIVITKDDEGFERGKTIPFWLYFPNCRDIFINAETYNRNNDAQRITYDDIFWKRMFNSYVVKESNVYDRAVEDYSTGLDAILEAEKIKEDIFNFEQDLWHY
ncbi:MAG: gliding motility protein GldN [Bacteroidetes bacterium]|nr:gliding motility protein GldN [Bacteroidota bacterium]HET6243241.1 gliding motility protein GldN [Bacteroidia bacterium]